MNSVNEAHKGQLYLLFSEVEENNYITEGYKNNFCDIIEGETCFINVYWEPSAYYFSLFSTQTPQALLTDIKYMKVWIVEIILSLDQKA